VKLGLVRDRPGLEAAIETARAIHAAANATLIHTHGDLIAVSELKDLCEAALACAQSALCRTESRAAHYRSDFPETDPDWARTVVIDGTAVGTRALKTDPDEKELLAYRAVGMQTRTSSEREHVE
jgi:succinate dehydrogenase / fumarate reductase, flavoprotein subunit